MKRIIGIALIFACLEANAVLVQGVGIQYVGVYGNGDIFAALDANIPVPGCSGSTWLRIASNHPQKSEIYSLLLTAMASDKKLDISSNACLSGSATISTASSDYVLAK